MPEVYVFLDNMPNQNKLFPLWCCRSGSVIIPHNVIYNFSKEGIRGMSVDEFYDKSIKAAVESGRMGSLAVVVNCTTCQVTKGEWQMLDLKGKQVLKTLEHYWQLSKNNLLTLCISTNLWKFNSIGRRSCEIIMKEKKTTLSHEVVCF